MDISSILPQAGISAIFIFVAYKLYNDMRQDSLRREDQIRIDSKEREEKLMQHLDKVSDTLENINNRLVKVEQNVCIKNGVGE